MFPKQCRRLLLLSIAAVVAWLQHLLLLHHGSQAIQFHPYPLTRLDESNNLRMHKLIDYMALDQCMLRPGQDEVRSYGIQFRLRQHNFLCADGLLFCYPSQLGGRTLSGVGPHIQYQISNRKQNIVAKMCRDIRRIYCQKRASQCTPGQSGSVPWHGLLVTTDSQGQNVTMQLSFSNQNYTFPAEEEFRLEFGSQHSLDTSLVLANGQHKLFAEDEARRAAFLADVHRGAKLANYAGLWALGLDMLEVESERKLHLYVSRGCKCSMDAWFTRPTDLGLPGPLSPKYPISVGHGPAYCAAEPMNSTMPLIGLKEEMKVTLHMLVNEQPKNISVDLLDKRGKVLWGIVLAENSLCFGGKDFAKNHFTLTMLANWGTAEDDDGQRNKPLTCIQETQLFQRQAKAGKPVALELRFYRNRYEILAGPWAHGPPTHMEYVWPAQWWHPLPFEELGSLRVQGDAALLNWLQPEQAPPSELASPATPPIYMQLAPRDGDELLSDQWKMRLHGTVNPHAESLEFSFHFDAPEFNKYVGATLLRYHVNLKTNKVEMDSFVNQTVVNEQTGDFKASSLWLDEGIAKSPRPFELTVVVQETPVNNVNVTVEIDAHERDQWKQWHTTFTITVRNPREPSKVIIHHFESGLPLNTLHWARLVGDFTPIMDPISKYSQNTTDKYNEYMSCKKYALPERLLKGAEICLRVMSPAGDGRVTVDLHHQSSEHSAKIGDTALHAWFIFSSSRSVRSSEETFQLDSYQHSTGKWTETTHLANPVFIGNKMNLCISVGGTGFAISNYENAQPLQYPHVIPPWAVNWVQLRVYDDGGAHHNFEMELCGKDKEAGRPLWFKQVKPAMSPHQHHKRIVIEGELLDWEEQQPNANISVNFFHDALDWHPTIGITVFQANISRSQITFGSYFDGKWQNEKSHLFTKWLNPGPFRLSIMHGGEQKLQISIDGVDQTFEHKLEQIPFWAVQFVVVKGAYDEMEEEDLSQGGILKMTKEIEVNPFYG